MHPLQNTRQEGRAKDREDRITEAALGVFGVLALAFAGRMTAIVAIGLRICPRTN